MGHALCVCSRGTVIIDNKRYLFIQKLGEGGFSYVDLVEGLHDGHFYALKRILCHEQQDREEAQREADMHHLFNHPNILHLVAYCLRERGAKHEAWLLLPFFKRPEAHQYIAWRRRAASFNGLGFHESSMHPRGGLPPGPDPAALGPLFQDWAAQRCTISYRAPELFSVQSHCVIDERTDVWSLGCVLYAMMFGEGPYDMVFQKGDSVALAVQNQLSIPQSPRHSSALRQLLASMMTVDPQQRPHIPQLLSQLEVLQPPAPGQHTTQI
ncbi:serine/threonine-protein kinase 16 isoform X3 [Callithrix jacchus]|uniref:serine/threonine-protein kinase 16 isoform X3 n=1 Tax=Callithrix jacchus TaxID=9483 RepID=UPI0004F0030F|nr:serine/threonine-protein kinase 16 isoform X3 [Callithrix jacchus]